MSAVCGDALRRGKKSPIRGPWMKPKGPLGPPCKVGAWHRAPLSDADARYPLVCLQGLEAAALTRTKMQNK